MKFLCPNCKAKYRIGSDKLVGRQAAKIHCRKCDYRIQIAPRTGSDEYDITATPTSVVPAVPLSRAPKAAVAPAVPGPAVAAPRLRPAPTKEDGAGARKPVPAVVPGLPGLGAPKGVRGAVPHQAVPQAEGIGAAPLGSGRRPLPAPPAPPFGGLALAGAGGSPAVSGGAAPVWPAAAPAPLPPIPAPSITAAPAPVPAPRPPPQGNQLADQFRQSVQAGGLPEEIPQDGWFVGVNGVPLGPIPVGDLRELAAAGHIDRRSLVWREGLAEWKPLGKFPQLARLLGDGGAPTSAESPSVPARANGINGHAATGFDAPRPVLADGERPSAWGDLDDEEDEDEQPTTVKGRVSLPPPDNHVAVPAHPLAAHAAVPARPAAAPGFAPLPFSAPVPRAPSDVAAQHPNAAPPVGAGDGVPASTISTTPEPVVDEADARMMRPRGRGRIYLIVLAIVTAFALGAIITRAIEPPAPPEGAKEPTSEPARALAPPPAETAKVAVEEVIEPPPEEEAALEPTTSPLAPELAPVRRNGPTSAPVTAAPTQPVRTGGSLLSGLGAQPTPGPSIGGGARSDGRGGGAGLDATAIQRTVRRYSPAVRQNCWQRALNTRAPGVPSSAKVTALITVDAAGRVQSVSVSGAPKGYPGLARCIEGSVKGWQFPRAGGETVTNVPFMFVGQ